MEKFHVYHISFFDSLLHGLKSNGVSLQNITSQSYINRFDLNNPNTYLPLEVAYEFLGNIKRKQGVDCFVSEFYTGFQMDELGDYGEFVAGCPDLQSILMNGIKYESLVQTNSKARLEVNGAKASISVPHIDEFSEGRLISEKINLAIIINTMQLALGKEWQPFEIEITSKDGYWVQNLLPQGNYVLKTARPAVKVHFYTSELAKKNPFYRKNDDSYLPESKNPVTRITEVLSSIKYGYLPTLDELSDYFGISKRTMIRSLNSMGSSFKQIHEEHLYNRSIELLEAESLSVDQISRLLGYSDPSNYIRAFKRWTTFTPYKYRKQLAGIRLG